MSVYTDGPGRGFKAETDLSAKQFFIVKLGTAANTIVLAAAATDAIVGILMNEPKLNETGKVRLPGGGKTSKVKIGGTVAKGDLLTANANGEAITTTTAGDFVIGRALKAQVSGDVAETESLAFRY